MRKMKSLLCWAMMMVLLLGMSVTCLAVTNPFKDVKKSAFYYDAVLWAVEQNITSGVSKTEFGPNAACTRGQTVTFLWRAAGCPNPTTQTNPFKDVKKSDFYYKAVLWAVENNVTAGTSKNTFGPNEACTRGQIVTFMWRSQGAQKVNASNPFKDVQKKDFYYNAVLWAVKNNITAGVSKDAFAPGDTCTRGQIVTFLYRYVGGCFSVVVQPAAYQMTSSSEDASFYVTVKDGIAPYTYRWFICFDNNVVPITPVVTSDNICTAKHRVTDYDFDEYSSIKAYCEITDAAGHKVKSDSADVRQYNTMVITQQPVDYQMTSSSEDATFRVTVSGGVGPYTYEWTVWYDNNDLPYQPVQDIIRSNVFSVQVTDYDFDDYNGIGVICKITDSTGRSVTTDFVKVLQKH